MSNQQLKDSLLNVFPRGVIAFDVETTGLSPLVDRVVELSAVKLTSSGELEYFSTLVNPNGLITEESISIHGITNSMVKGKPTIDVVLPSFLEFIGNLPLVAHHARFDVGFLIFAIHAANLDVSSNEVFCSLKCSRMVLDELDGYKLATLAKYLDITLTREHRALDDSNACLQIMGKCLERGKGREEECLEVSRLFNLADFGKGYNFVLPASLDMLKTATKDRIVVDIEYQGGKKPGTWRAVRPIGLLPMPDGNVLYAHCLTSDQPKSFFLKRVSGIRCSNVEKK